MVVKFLSRPCKLLSRMLLPIHPMGSVSLEESNNATTAFSSVTCMENLALAASNKKPNSNFLKQLRKFIGSGKLLNPEEGGRFQSGFELLHHVSALSAGWLPLWQQSAYNNYGTHMHPSHQAERDRERERDKERIREPERDIKKQNQKQGGKFHPCTMT